jgi:hypothetical protein
LADKDLIIINPLEDDRWDHFVDRHEHGSIFATSTWFRILHSSYGFAVRAFVRENANGEIHSAIPVAEVKPFWIMPKKWICVPFADFTNPLINSLEGNDSLITFLLDHARDKGIANIQIHGSILGRSHGFRKSTNFVQHELILPEDPDTLFDSFHPSQGKRQITKARKEEVQVEIRRDIDAVHEFHRLDVMTRRRQGTSPHPRRFLNEVHRHAIQKKKGFCLLASRGNKIIAAHIYLVHGKTILYKYGASDAPYLKVRPNHILIWEAMQWAIENGYNRFHFGKTNLSQTGMRHIKLKPWGSVEKPLPYFVWRKRPEIGDYRFARYLMEKAKLNVFGRAPAPVSIFLSNILYRHFA